ncbi:MAG: hypothetical protein H6576_01200 [Lewinellaceae bacterium]|nr:hypothetical protein [Saprospiraceae bacterium]MCB9342295.1 hypothetical protein [Lewinellaceae bacterium]
MAYSMLSRNHSILLAFYLIATCMLAWISRNDPFFWDTVQLGSKHAHFFYENGLHWIPLPQDIDSGHPPVFGYYLAMVWTVFGKSLLTGHVAMLPFLFANTGLLWLIGRKIAGDTWGAWLPLLVLADPVLLGQSVMISPDIVVTTGFLLSVYAVLANRKILLSLGVLMLCAISMRGMMTAAAIGVWAIFLSQKQTFDLKPAVKTALYFLPGFVFASWFLWWHYSSTGWLGYHPESPWARAFSRVDLQGFIRNIAVLGWRWLDFGRIAEIIALVILLPVFVKRKLVPFTWQKLQIQPVLVLFGLLLLFLSPSALLYENLSAHRYFLPAFIGLHFLVIQLISSSIKSIRFSKSLFVIMVVMLFGCNWWIYPRGISMDWDSTLAHRPYHSLRALAIQFIDEHHIDFKEVGSAFPNLNTGESLMLNGDSRQFSPKNYKLNKYILTSNVFNDLGENDYEILERDWSLIWRNTKNGVWMELYKKPVE